MQKISYYNLRDEAERLPILVGREQEMERLSRVIGRRITNNVLIVGENGTGKTALLWGSMREASTQKEFDSYALLQFDTSHLALLEDSECETFFAEALGTMPRSIVCIDDSGKELFRNAALMQRFIRLYSGALRSREVHLALTLLPQEYAWLQQEFPAFVQMFETVRLKEQTAAEYGLILREVLPRINPNQLIVPQGALQEIVTFSERFKSMGHMPRSAIRLLDESLVFAASRGARILSHEHIAHVVEAKTGVPKAQLSKNDLHHVKDLEKTLGEHIVDQDMAIKSIAQTLQRAKLGLRDTNRPLGSFLMLGPSGVGKTETAKCVAQLLFGKSDNFIRFDMSEFQQDHTVQRLIGAPAGYIGYGEGGALTNALRKEPHSLVLLDEIEKAHPKVFDIFLQVLDDGRLTSGENETVDARNSIIMATSNAAVSEILQACESGEIDRDDFIAEKILPILTATFRPEFINRFDKIIIFKPLTVASLMRIAQLEIRKTEARLSKHRVRFDIESTELQSHIEHMMDPRFGARPVKRFVEETCETLLMRSLLAHT